MQYLPIFISIMLANWYKYLISGITLFIFTSSFSQSFNFKNITTEDGLASSECYKIIQDKKGYIWIATDAGLCKYNGKEFKTFTTDHGLPSNTMFDILEGPDERIWGGCFNGGIFYIQNDSVYTIAANPELIKIFNVSKEIIRKLIFDRNGILHVGTTEGYYQVLPEKNYHTIIKLHHSDSSYIFIKQIENEILFSRIHGKFFSIQNYKHVFESKERNFTFYIDYVGKKLSSSLFNAKKDNNGNLIFIISNAVFIYKEQLLQQADFSTNIIQCYIDHENNLWLGTYGEGYLMYPGCDLSLLPVKGLPGKNVSGFYQDSENGMWITTINEGVFYCPNTSIYSFAELQGKNIPAIGIGAGNIYATTSVHEVWKVNNSQIKFILSSKDPTQSEKMNFSYINNKMYLGGGFAFYFDHTNKYQQFFNNSKDFNFTLSQFIQEGNNIWAINYEILFLIENNTWAKKFLLPSRGFCAFYSSKKEILIGCLDGLYEFKNDQFNRINIHPHSKNVRISFITEDKQHNILVSTRGHGVFIRKGDIWINLNTSHGLSSNLCNHIHSSNDGKYYISTNRGLCMYFPGSKIPVRRMDISNGLLSNEVNMCITDSEKVYVATEKGLCYFNTKKEVYNTFWPKLYVNHIKLNNNSLVVSKEYPYYMNDLSFKCDVLSYQQPKANKIRYQLFPIDKTPRYSSSSEVNYDNLPPGNYNLVIYGINNNGVEGAPQKYQFTICPPFWGTWWFVTICSILFISAVYIIVRKRISYIRKRDAEKNLLKEKIVEYHYTALRAQMNPHFIFNVINSIQLYVLNNQPKEAYNYLSKFSKLIRRVLQNSKEKLISLVDEMETIRLYMELEQIRLEGNVEFQVKIDPVIDPGKTLVPSMIIQPLLENAIWHGIVPLKGSRMGKVQLHILSENDMLKILILDNGNGIDLNKKSEDKGSFGLNLIKDRLSLLSGESKIEVANQLDKQNNVKGVEVTLLMPFIKN